MRHSPKPGALRTLLHLGLAWLLAMSAVTAAAQAPQVLTAQEQAFVARISADNTEQVTLARTAEHQSDSARVRALAARIIDDAKAINLRLARYTMAKKSIGQAHGVPPKRVAAYQQQLSKLRGDAFDRAWLEMVVRDAERALPLYQAAGKNLTHQALRTIARDGATRARQHLEAAREMMH